MASASSQFGSFWWNLSTRTSIGTQGISGLAFEPKIFIPISCSSAAEGNEVDCEFGFGVAIKAGSAEHCMFGHASDGVGTTDSTIATIAKAVALPDFTGDTIVEANVSAWADDGLTLDYTKVDGTARLLNGLILGGSDFEVLGQEEITSPASTGEVAYDAMGFAPDGLIFTCARTATAVPHAQFGMTPTIGFVCCRTGVQRFLSCAAENGVGTSNGNTWTDDDDSVGMMTEAGAEEEQFTFKSRRGKGYVLDWTKVVATGYKWTVTAIKGPQFCLIDEYSPTSVQQQSALGSDFPPEAAIALSGHRFNTTNTPGGDGSLGIGIGLGPTERAVGVLNDEDAKATSQCDHNYSKAALTKNKASNGFSHPVRADWHTTLSDGIELDYEAVHTAARRSTLFMIGKPRRRDGAKNLVHGLSM